MQLPYHDISPNEQVTQEVPASNMHQLQYLEFASVSDPGVRENHVSAIQELYALPSVSAAPSDVAPINEHSQMVSALCPTFPTQQSTGYKTRYLPNLYSRVDYIEPDVFSILSKETTLPADEEN